MMIYCFYSSTAVCYSCESFHSSGDICEHDKMIFSLINKYKLKFYDEKKRYKTIVYVITSALITTFMIDSSFWL